ncbi:MAG: hypothetical protein SRB2_03831 [Desulfobacteraceae bacterium Eth-SRB2]|nr:MAG: hypothetical protein SRB2_03831 [Desulfobacteraceae bacterium Eth-SRB2]
MLKTIIITIEIIFIAFELIEHLIFPLFWFIFKGRKRSTYGVMGMIGKVVEIKRWDKIEGQVLIKLNKRRGNDRGHVLPIRSV